MSDAERLAVAISLLRSPEVEAVLTRKQRDILNRIDPRVFGIRVELDDRLPGRTVILRTEDPPVRVPWCQGGPDNCGISCCPMGCHGGCHRGMALAIDPSTLYTENR